MFGRRNTYRHSARPYWTTLVMSWAATNLGRARKADVDRGEDLTKNCARNRNGNYFDGSASPRHRHHVILLRSRLML